MLTIDRYFLGFENVPKEHHKNAELLIKKINSFERILMEKYKITISWEALPVAKGQTYRTQDVSYGASKSKHKTAEALDIPNSIVNNLKGGRICLLPDIKEILLKTELYMEAPKTGNKDNTPYHTHLQSVSVPSGNIIFNP